MHRKFPEVKERGKKRKETFRKKKAKSTRIKCKTAFSFWTILPSQRMPSTTNRGLSISIILHLGARARGIGRRTGKHRRPAAAPPNGLLSASSAAITPYRLRNLCSDQRGVALQRPKSQPPINRSRGKLSRPVLGRALA
ncbi:hypothetical protein EVAR_43775_1 [Eumeta japonica]|uniref:Uncharacterized protein n=1 Tax=Eumeta variegata TaxID=151549 RepID=A0A4C1XLC4_EUMVA|nr:hypothetical protein EVAR_43775_1 [Eumeta japonica]